MKPKDWTRLVISLAVIALFAAAYLRHPDNALLIGALISTFTTAVNWWLGSSQGSSDKTAQLEELSTPRRVVVENSADDPVPVEPKP